MNKINILFKEKLSRFYAIFLIFLIPVLIITNSLWRISVYQKNMQLELTQKTELTAGIISSSISSDLTDSVTLQAKINQIKISNPIIDEIDIIVPSDSGLDYPIAASTDSNNIGVSLNDSELDSIWQNETTKTVSIKTYQGKNSQKYWSTTKIIKNDLNEKIGILNLKLSTTDIDKLCSAAINQSLILLVLTVFVVFLLLVNYFRFFEYFVKYRKIQEIDKMKDEFISIVSHEIKTPLAAVKGYLDMVIQGLTGKIDQNAKDHLVKVFANVQRLDLLVSELLDVSRLEQDRMQFDMQPVDAGKIMSEVLNEIGDKAKLKGLEIEHIIKTQLPPIFADPDRLHQVYENLVGNAIKYTLKGKITINYSLLNGNLLTSITDTGIGMSAEDSSRLFERFYRIKNEKTADISGTGLGLWISLAIAKRMNGNITFITKENTGTTFTIVMPFIKENK